MTNAPPTAPTCSIIVPVYNDPTGIDDILGAIASQTVDRYEVVVVDNGSTDETREVAGAYADRNDHVTLLVEDEVQGSYAARNEGIRRSTGDVFAFLDADETVADDWLETVLAAMTAGDADYLGCHVDLTIPDDENTLTARYNAHTGFPVEQYLARHRYAPTCALFVRREVFEDVGLFDPRLLSGGDMEFGNRVDAAGYEMGYCADAVVNHPVRSSFHSLYGKNVRVGRGHCQLQRYYPERYGEPPIPPRHPPLDTDAPEISPRDRLAFGALSTAMTAARASGYARELVSLSDTGADVDGPPSL
jgi:glycosyltransferase involved in cell wall biosynthesis